MKSHLTNWNLDNKCILLRADLNVPLKNGAILDDTRLRALQPTLDYILSRGGSIVLATHIGRPKDNEPKLSTQHLLPWFKKHNYTINWQPNIDTVIKPAQGTITLLENLRFYPGEKNNDATFAQKLAQWGDLYVNDAFGTMHRNDASITRVPKLFDIHKRTVGFLVEKELKTLHQLRSNPQQPCVLLLGGSKASDKIPVIAGLLDKIQTLVLLPAIVFTFMRALNKPVGKSLVDEASIPNCKDILARAQQQNITIIMPVDFQVAQGTIDGPLSIVSADDFPDDAVGISIGPRTIAHIQQVITPAKTIFFNGIPGFIDRKETLDGVHKLFDILAHAQEETIISGGDSIAAVTMFDLAERMDYLTTGGGATLTYLSGQSLPGLEVFKK